ncbi:MAG: phosphatidate cytidylyltransferase [Syntrophomonadaceae bacterium]|jgi:phosphatidate cytidylyltransferase
MLKTRVITALLGIPLVLAVLYLGGVIWIVFFSLLAALALFEFFAMMKAKNFTPLMLPGFLLLMVILFYQLQPAFLTHAILFIVTIIVLCFVLLYPRITLADVAISLFGVFYIGFLFHFVIQMGKLPDAFTIVLLAFVLTWASDTGGYLFGKAWGKHKMVPSLSPGKTWEGALGSVLLSTFISLAFFHFYAVDKYNLAYALLLGIMASVIAQLGDLFMSGIKRFFGVKDSGKIIPGHGGVLDRFDSFILVAPWIFIVFSWL